jgi:hypothetical protein
VEPTFPATASFTIDFDEVHNASVGILKRLEQANTPVSVGTTALILSVGRILSPEPMSDEEEAQFVQMAMEWMGIYFTEGTVN